MVLKAPVYEIHQGKDGVRISTSRGEWRAKACDRRRAPDARGRIEYSPKLPGSRDQLDERVPMGSVVKCMAVDDEPSLARRRAQRDGDERHGSREVTYDNSRRQQAGVPLGSSRASCSRADSGRQRNGARRFDSFARYFGDRARTDARDDARQELAEDEWSWRLWRLHAPAC